MSRSSVPKWVWFALAGVPASLAIAYGNHVAKERDRHEEYLRQLHASGLSPRVALAFSKAMDPVLDSPEVLRLMGQATGVAESQAVAARSNAEGLALLPAAELAEYARRQARLAERDPEYCAGLWRASVSAAVNARALDRLNDEELASWFHLNGLALRARATHARPASHPEAIRNGILAIMAGLPEIDRALFARDFQNATLTDTRACELQKIVLSGADRLPPAQRTAFLRELYLTSAAPPPGA